MTSRNSQKGAAVSSEQIDDMLERTEEEPKVCRGESCNYELWPVETKSSVLVSWCPGCGRLYYSATGPGGFICKTPHNPPSPSALAPEIFAAIIRDNGGEIRVRECDVTAIPPYATITEYRDDENRELVFQVHTDSC